MSAGSSKTHVGLTLGKFAPLHRGHQHLIETALSEVDRLIVMIYDCPAVTEVALHVRARWIRDLYPQVEVIEAFDGPSEVGTEPEITQAHDAYILRMLAGRRVTHFYSSEFYGDHVSRALGAEDRRVDPQRTHFPISGTRVRESPYEYRSWIAPLVYRDLIRNVVFMGAPSTGKTTLCQRLALRYHTQWMPECGREYWETHQQDRRLTPEQLVEIGEVHIEREDKLLLESNRYLFTDTNALTTLLFARHYHGYGLPRLEQLADATASRYALTFLCDDDIPYEDTWDRSGDANRREFQEWTIEELRRRGIAYTLLTGSVDEREARVVDVLGTQWR
jgi:HTH-type transcriptional regulator, transcriptional repressor of NAD biosynthesis genes